MQVPKQNSANANQPSFLFWIQLREKWIMEAGGKIQMLMLEQTEMNQQS